MTRAKSALKILTEATDMQRSVADMLESKAMDMESLRDWLMHTVRSSHFDSDHDLVKQTVEFHNLMIDILQGVTKMECGLARHMKLLLEEQEAFGGHPGFDGLFSAGDDA